MLSKTRRHTYPIIMGIDPAKRNLGVGTINTTNFKVGMTIRDITLWEQKQYKIDEKNIPYLANLFVRELHLVLIQTRLVVVEKQMKPLFKLLAMAIMMHISAIYPHCIVKEISAITWRGYFNSINGSHAENKKHSWTIQSIEDMEFAQKLFRAHVDAQEAVLMAIVAIQCEEEFSQPHRLQEKTISKKKRKLIPAKSMSSILNKRFQPTYINE
jgi:hypothetical protein